MNTPLAAEPSSKASDAMRCEPRTHCMLCGGAGELLYEDVPDHLFGVPGRWSLRRCRDTHCGLVWQDPMVIQDDLWRAYSKYHTHAALHKVRLTASFLATDRTLARLLRLGAERKRHALAYLDDLPPARLLDVGCGNGRFAAAMQDRGWTVRGTDFDPKAAENAMNTHGIQVDIGDLRELAYASESFDAVTLRHVIEHVRDPVEIVQECWRILKPGGRLVMVTPNTDSLAHRHFAARWRGLEQPRHLFLYNPSALQALLRRADIETGRVFSSAQGAMFGLRSSSEAERGRPHTFGDAFAIWWLALREVTSVRAGRQVGTELVACATKTAAAAAPP